MATKRKYKPKKRRDMKNPPKASFPKPKLPKPAPANPVRIGGRKKSRKKTTRR